MLQTSNLIINLDHDEWILDDMEQTLAQIGAGTCLMLSSPESMLPS
jgi:hypothetical protein